MLDAVAKGLSSKVGADTAPQDAVAALWAFATLNSKPDQQVRCGSSGGWVGWGDILCTWRGGGGERRGAAPTAGALKGRPCLVHLGGRLARVCTCMCTCAAVAVMACAGIGTQQGI